MNRRTWTEIVWWNGQSGRVSSAGEMEMQESGDLLDVYGVNDL